MPEHASWLSFIPGYAALEHAIASLGAGWLFSSAVMVQHIAAILLVILVLLLLALSARSQLERAKKSGDDLLPEARLSSRTIVEILLERLLGIMQFTMPLEAAMKHVWLIGTLGFFILFSNLLGLIPGFLPPTENYNTTFA